MKVFHCLFILSLLSNYCSCSVINGPMSDMVQLTPRIIYGVPNELLECAVGGGDWYFPPIMHFAERTTSNVYDVFSSSSVDKSDVKFFLYVKKRNDGTSGPIEINSDSLDINISNEYGNFRSKKIIIIIHGFYTNSSSPGISLLRDGFFQNGDYNIIVVDWSTAQFDTPLAYQAVVNKLDAVAEHVSKLLRSIENNGMGYLNETTIVGHSLGAHLAGLASSKLGGKIGRIVGLDPAGPLYSTTSPEQRLSKDDAMEVEAIHTDADGCGLEDSVGHYDFYVNGGRFQPGCDSHECSHSRVFQYFAESLDPKSKGFFGRFCDYRIDMSNLLCGRKILLMGGPTRKKKYAKTGIYSVKTNDESPYARGRSL